jgi:uncharacterized membrane protein
MLLVLGIIVLVIGLFCLFYRQAVWDYVYYGSSSTYEIVSWTYPYQTHGLILSIIGIVLAALSLLLPEKQEPQKT